MEQFFKNPGLVHIGETIFQNLEYQSFVNCQNLWPNFWEIIRENPHFWVRWAIMAKFPQENAATEKRNASEWKRVIIETFETSLKYKVLKIVLAQKATEDSLRSPLYMAVKVQDRSLIRHLLEKTDPELLDYAGRWTDHNRLDGAVVEYVVSLTFHNS